MGTKIGIGSVVTLNSGSPKMTVNGNLETYIPATNKLEKNKDMWVCKWFPFIDGACASEIFHTNALKLINE